MNIVDIDGSPVSNPAAPILWSAVFGIDNQQNTGHFLEGDRSEDDFIPLLNAQWDITQDIMLYAAYTEGAKSGGFDARSNSINSWEFEGEEATTY